MSRIPITRSGRTTTVERHYETLGDRGKYRNDTGGIDPFFDEVEDETEWKRVDLGGFPRGLDLIGVCLRIVWKDKEILAYQGISMALCLTLLFVFLSAMTNGFSQEYFEQELNPAVFIIQLFPYAIIASFIGAYFSGATMIVATIRMKGESPTFADGMKGATRKSPLIFSWAIYAAIVGTALALMRSRKGASRVSANVAELAWAVATYFVVPVMLFENKGPTAAIERSTFIMKRTWKESLAGNLGMGAVFFVLLILGMVVLIPIGFVIWGVAGGVIVVLPYIVFILTLSSAADNVLVAALYWLARTGNRPAEMDGYELPDIMPMFSGSEQGDPEDTYLTYDELMRKYAR